MSEQHPTASQVAIGWPDDISCPTSRERFTCSACGKRGADVRPDFNFSKQPVEMMGYR
jgi:hypothetical protein